ncbi:MAG: ATP-dependent Clp protease proteolytic subunit [Planctomycetaceae bacterium]
MNRPTRITRSGRLRIPKGLHKVNSSPHHSGPFNRDRQDQDWELAINGDITDKQQELVSSLIDAPRGSRGTLYFDSGGGSVYVGLALATVIRLRGLQPVAVVTGECSSAALLPFAACRTRLVTPHSTMLFHPMRWTSEEDVRMEEAAEWTRHFKVLEKNTDKLLAQLFDYPEEKLTEWIRPGRFVTGQELADAGLARVVDLFSGDLWSQTAETISNG